MSNRLNYIAIALTTHCNCNCFYCKETGESIIPNIKGTWDFNSLKKVIKVAYGEGLTTFRITGGEPTIVEYLPGLIHYIMDLGKDTKIRLNTNGYNLEYMLDLIEMYKDRVDVMISVDSLNEYVNGIYYPKYLSLKIEELAKELVKRKISTRFNIVVTKYNSIEVETLIDKALELTNKAVVDALGGLPAHKIHCSVLAEEAVKAAVVDYYEKNNIEYDKQKYCKGDCPCHHDHGENN